MDSQYEGEKLLSFTVMKDGKDQFDLAKWEMDEEFFNGYFDIVAEVKESVNFERGKDPKHAMGIGKRAEILNKLVDAVKDDLGFWSELYRIYEKEGFLHVMGGGPDFNKTSNASMKKHGIQEYLYDKVGETIQTKMEKKYGIKYEYMAVLRGIDTETLIKESINFERGMDPKRAMRIGDPLTVMELMLNDLVNDKSLGIFSINANHGHGFITVSTSPSTLKKELLSKFNEIGLNKYFQYDTVERSGGTDKYFYFRILPEYEEHISYPKSERDQLLTNAIFGPDDELAESISFKRGKDPKHAMDIGASRDALKIIGGMWLPLQRSGVSHRRR